MEKNNLYQGTKGKVYNYLVKEPRFRERKNKNRGIANLILDHWAPLTRLLMVKNDRLADIVGQVGSYDRAWRQCLEHHPELRGSDYGDKDVLEQEKQLELGYNV